MKKYININSELLGVGIGFLSFYIIFFLWNMSWGVSFVISFTFGFFSSKFLDVCASKINGEDLDKERATEISKTVNDFEKNDLL